MDDAGRNRRYSLDKLARIEYILPMPSTTVHFPPEILKSVDAVAGRRGISRNRFVIQACEQAVLEDAGEWPDGFFALDLGADDAALLGEATEELEQAVLVNRKSRGAPLL